jgi:MFS transporter, OFA family, oxalate/formate antiporter
MIFRGWIIVGGAFMVLAVAYGAQYSFGLFFAALVEEFHWSRAGLSGVFSVYAFAYSCLGFAAGRATDRWGPRVVIGVGGACLGGALAGMALVTRLWQPYVLYGGLAALGMSTAFVPCSTTVVRWFHQSRGLAVGIAATGQSVGTLFLPPLAHLLIARVGWRASYLIFGAGVAVTLSTMSRVMHRDPEAVGLRPWGAAGHPPTEETSGGYPFTAALATRAFWMLVAVFALTWIPVFIPLVHLVIYARDLGFPAVVGAWATGAIGAGAIGGRLVMGAASDRFGRKRALVIGLVLESLAFLGFVTGEGLATLVGSAFLFGYAYAAVSVTYPPIIVDYFGRAHAGAIVGGLFAIAGSASGMGPVAAGAIRDATGSYAGAFIGAAALNAAAVLLALASRPPAPRQPLSL